MQIFYSDKHLGHDTASLMVEEPHHGISEVPARAEIIRAAVEAAGLGAIQPPTDHGLEPILAVHESDMVSLLQTAYERVSAERQAPAAVPHTFAARFGAPRPTRTVWGQMGHYALDVAAPIMAGTWEAAYWSAQCALSAADGLASDGMKVMYALCRPPGHHAARDLYGGYCYLNNAAIAARYLQRLLGEGARDKVAILDFDFHHGNGTQAIFYDDPSVLFCSLHADPLDEYPYFWGHADERGEGEGVGFNRNWPLPLGTGDAVYLKALDEAIAAVCDYGPRWLVVSAGFDVFTGDPVGGFNVTTEGFARIGRAIAGLGLPTLIMQEGGYLLDKLGENAVAFLEAFR